MNEQMLSQVYRVLCKYDKNYTRDGILKNLNEWERNKAPLLDLLRRHPNWHEDAFAVVFEVTQSREIDRYAVNGYNNDLYQLSGKLGLSYEDANSLCSALNTAAGTYAKLLPDEQIASTIKEYTGISCVPGQKASRVIHKICQKYGLDRHPDYNSRFAKLADSLNPMQVKRTALLSIHPCDYLEMSNEDNSWSSCHCIRDGEYHAGALSYMNDRVSMIFYTVDEEVTEDYHRAPKRTRQVFCYGDGILLQSRLYPGTDDEESRSIYRDIVQRTVSHCLGLPNLWKLHRSMEDVDRCCSTHSDALHYTDYTHKCFKPNVSLLKEAHTDDGRKIVIGNPAYCLDCSNRIRSSDTLYCDSCGYDTDYITCEDCGERIERESDDDYYVGDGHYCRDCVSWCESCHEYTRDEMTHVHDRNGCRISICESCRDDDYEDCEDCGRYFHRDTGEELGDGFHCRDCLDRRYFTCDSCLDYVRCEDAQEIEGKLYCAICAGELKAQAHMEEAECSVTARGLENDI